MALFEQIQQLLATANNSTIHYLSHQLNLPDRQCPICGQSARQCIGSIGSVRVPINLCVYNDYAIAHLNMPTLANCADRREF